MWVTHDRRRYARYNRSLMSSLALVPCITKRDTARVSAAMAACAVRRFPRRVPDMPASGSLPKGGVRKRVVVNATTKNIAGTTAGALEIAMALSSGREAMPLISGGVTLHILHHYLAQSF